MFGVGFGRANKNQFLFELTFVVDDLCDYMYIMSVLGQDLGPLNIEHLNNVATHFGLSWGANINNNKCRSSIVYKQIGGGKNIRSG